MIYGNYGNNYIQSACQCLALMIIKKLCEVYGLNPKEHYNCELMHTLLINRRLCNINKLLSQLNNVYFNITFQSKYPTFDFEEHYNTAKNILNDNKLQYIPRDMPLTPIKTITNIIKKLLEIYELDSNLNPKNHHNYRLMETLLLNRSLNSNNSLLFQLSKTYNNIIKKARYLTYDDFERYYGNTENMLNDSRLKNIPKDIPLDKIKLEYENYKNNNKTKRTNSNRDRT